MRLAHCHAPAALALILVSCASAPSHDREHGQGEERAHELACERLHERWVLELRVRPDRGERRVEIDAEGRGTLVVTRFEGYLPRPEPPVGFTLDRARFREVVRGLRELPRAEHVAIGNLGADVTLQRTGSGVIGSGVIGGGVTGGDAELRHESYGSRAPALMGLGELLAERLGRAPFEELLRVPARTGASWRVAQHGDAVPALRAALCAEPPDPEVERLAAPVAIERAAFALVPELRAAFERSKRRDPNGDYFQALVLLRLGDPIGVETVLRIAQTPKPDWALGAAHAINASFAELYGQPPIPAYDFRDPSDPRPAAADAFARFLAERSAPLAFDREGLSYR